MVIMDDIAVNDYCGRFEYVEFGAGIPEDHFVHFVVSFVRNFLRGTSLIDYISFSD